MSFKSAPVHKPSFFFLSRCTNSRVRWAQSQGGIQTPNPSVRSVLAESRGGAEAQKEHAAGNEVDTDTGTDVVEKDCRKARAPGSAGWAVSSFGRGFAG